MVEPAAALAEEVVVVVGRFLPLQASDDLRVGELAAEAPTDEAHVCTARPGGGGCDGAPREGHRRAGTRPHLAC